MSLKIVHVLSGPYLSTLRYYYFFAKLSAQNVDPQTDGKYRAQTFS